ncbi:MAG: NAD-dependent epimerase/dehydratase family protein [Phycisphaerales bacterium]|nr:MAG: NAD-dependent epimerase/dehydratase family protein [Phycisphaerales bacterium]
MDLRGKTILITGGCGLIGSTILDQLVRDEDVGQVRIIDNLTRGTLLNVEWARANGSVDVIQEDIRAFDAIRPHFDGVDVVFHQAAIRITACAEQWRECQEVLVDGTFNVAEACVQAGVRKLVAASSASVYGLADTFPTPEGHPLYNNRTWYGAAKIANEALYRAFHDMTGLDYVALRYFNVYGPRMDVFGKYTEVLIRWLDCLDQGQRPAIFGDGSQTMDFVFSEDVARANILAATSDVSDQVFNVASGTETSLSELLRTLLLVTEHPDIKPTYLPARAVNPVRRRLADTAKAASLLGFQAQVSLEEGLRRLVAWRRQAVRSRHMSHYDPAGRTPGELTTAPT